MSPQPAESPFEEIRLLTKDGHYVVTAIVPKFRPQADVLLWGERVFVRPEPALALADYCNYIEGFMVAVVNQTVDP